MTSSSTLARLALLVSIPLGIAACFVDGSDHSTPRGEVATAGGGTPTAPGANGGSSSSGGDGQASQYPILAKVDTDQTMQVNAGQGVGVFAEYVSGGHWRVSWTCDTSVNPQGAPCSFDVKIVVANGGAMTNITTQQFEPSTDALKQPDGSTLEATTSTSTGFDRVLFDTPPGATLTLSATVGGLYDGRFLFFVENGKIDDGYQGTVTDPIQLVPTTP